MRNILLFFLSTILLISLAACQGDTQQLERMPGIDLPLQEMNKDINLSAPSYLNDFKMRENIWLVFYNTSDLPVDLSQEYGVSIFQNNGDEWVQVENHVDYPPSDKWILANGSDEYLWDAIVVNPHLFSDKPIQLRIVILGNFVKENGRIGKEAGAYKDVTLNP
jgi:hypothetical protein